MQALALNQFGPHVGLNEGVGSGDMERQLWIIVNVIGNATYVGTREDSTITILDWPRPRFWPAWYSGISGQAQAPNFNA